MSTRGLLTLISVLALGCAGGNDPGESGTEIGSGTESSDTMPTTSGPGSSSSSSSSTDPTDDDTTTTEDADSSSSTSEGSSSTGSESSTGDCVLSTEGCPCDPASDPECGDGLVCNDENVCVAAACDDKDDEPNNDPLEPAVLMDLGEDDEPVTIMSQLTEDTDVDWFQWTCNEPFFGLTTPDLDVEAPIDVRTCLFLDCPVGGNPDIDCPEGTTAANAPLDNMPGCCVVGPGSFTLDPGPNCPGGSNDNVIANLRVDGGEEGVCNPYSFSYGC